MPWPKKTDPKYSSSKKPKRKANPIRSGNKSALRSKINETPVKNGSRFTEQQKKFCDEYLIDCNGRRAAMAAGYSKKTADQIGYQLLKKPLVRQYLVKGIKRNTKRNNISADRVLQEIAKVAFASLGAFMSIDKEGNIQFKLQNNKMLSTKDDPLGVLAQFEQETYVDGRGEDAQLVKKTKIKLLDKMKALDMLGRYLMLFDGAGASEDPVTTAQKIGAALREMFKADN